MSDHEHEKRASETWRMFITGCFTHSDIARYQLYLESNRFQGRSVMNYTEAGQMLERLLKTVHVQEEVPELRLDMLPDEMKAFIGAHPVWKVEWMKSGFYMASMSEAYSNQIMGESEIMKIGRVFAYPPKLVDNCNLVDYTTAFKTWTASVMAPMTVIVSPTMAGFNRETAEVTWTTVRMMSHVITHEYIISATVVGRSMMMTM